MDERLKEFLEQETRDRETISRMLTVILELDEIVADLKKQNADLKERNLQ